jgi:uncharacterized protein
MKCPNCHDASLLMTERQGVEIDYCPVCRGVWLDRGELDKLVDRAAAPDGERALPKQTRPSNRDFEDTRPRGFPARDSDGYGRRKKSWMSEIFD